MNSTTMQGNVPMSRRQPEPAAIPPSFHAPFLERAGGSAEGGECGLAAFLTMRVVDQFVDANPDREAQAYQIEAALGYVHNLFPKSEEVDFLEQIVQSARAVHDGGAYDLFWCPLAGFATWLERDVRYGEALDVLDTLIRLARGRDDGMVMTTELQRGRVLRRLGRAPQSTAAYGAAGDLALALGDAHTELLSRIGRGIVLQQLGNLPAAGKLLDQVRREAASGGDRDAEARATHDLAVNHSLQGHPAESVQFAFRAFQLYETAESRYRALGDLATALQTLGHHTAAKDAYELILDGDIPMGMRITTILELLGVASAMDDRVSFERRRREIGELGVELPPDPLVDFEIKLGVGLAAFGQLRAGRGYLKRAIRHAEEYNLNEYLFRAEALLDNLETEIRDRATPQVDWSARYPEVAEVAGELHHLRA